MELVTVRMIFRFVVSSLFSIIRLILNIIGSLRPHHLKGQTMQGTRSYLLDALARVLQGAVLGPEEPGAAVPDVDALSKRERDAWEQLNHWAGEADVRAEDENYAKFHLDWLRDLHAQLAR
jgi:hypothetical protein